MDMTEDIFADQSYGAIALKKIASTDSTDEEQMCADGQAGLAVAAGPLVSRAVMTVLGKTA